MINWKFEVEDVVCPVDDMTTTDCSRSFVQRGWSEGRENKGSGYELMSDDADGARLPRGRMLKQVTWHGLGCALGASHFTTISILYCNDH